MPKKFWIPDSPSLIAFIVKSYEETRSIDKTTELVRLEWKRPISPNRVSMILKDHGVRMQRYIPSLYDAHDLFDRGET